MHMDYQYTVDYTVVEIAFLLFVVMFINHSSYFSRNSFSY